MNNIYTTANTVSNHIEDSQTATAGKSCWQTCLAGFLFWTTVVVQFLMINNDTVDYAFADHIIYNILPLTGALAYWGLKKDTAANNRNHAPNSDC